MRECMCELLGVRVRDVRENQHFSREHPRHNDGASPWLVCARVAGDRSERR